MTKFDRIVVEIKFDGVSWTDVSAYLNSAPVTIRQGRPTEYDDTEPGRMTLTLDNFDGRFMPDNNLSPYWPDVVEGREIRVKLVRGATTWTRFWGWITTWTPEFPGNSTTDAVVQVAAVDNLGLLARQTLRSCWLGSGQYNCDNAGVRFDGFILDGDGIATHYFDNVTTSTGTKMRATTVDATDGKGPISYGPAEGLSVESAATFAPASDRTGTVIKMEMNGSATKGLQFWIRIPTELQLIFGAVQQLDVVSFWDATNTTSYGSIRLTLNGTSITDLGWFNGAGTFIATLGSVVTQNRWTYINVIDDGSGGGADINYDGFPTNVVLPWSVVKHAWFGGRGTLVPRMSIAGPMLLGAIAAEVDPQQGLTAGTGWTVSTRMSPGLAVGAVVSINNEGSDSTAALTGSWHGRKASEVGQEIARSGGGVLWAKSRDSQVTHIAGSLCYPASPLATVDSDGDLDGPPRFVRGAEARPTRITVNYPGGKATVIDTAAEAGGGGAPAVQRPKTIDTELASFTDAEARGTALLARAAYGQRVKSMTIDLQTCTTDLAPVFFDESTALSGLFPTCKLRVLVPTSFFSGSPTRDVFVEGWTERYSQRACTIEFDCSAASSAGGAYPSSSTYPSSATYPGV